MARVPKWMIKAAIQGCLARLPARRQLNRFFQRYISRTLELDRDYFLSKWNQVETHIDIFMHNAPLAEEHPVVLELGTGWFPVTPVGLALAGARKIITIDIDPLLTSRQGHLTIDRYIETIESGEIPLPDPELSLEQLRGIRRLGDKTPAELLAPLGIEVIVGDASNTNIPPSSLDWVISNNTLEHIPPPILEAILRELGRLLTPNGIMSHYIDMTDMYANSDAEITAFNFLQFTEKTWERFFNNEIQYQNRLRLSDFKKVHEKLGLQITYENHIRGVLKELRSVQLAPSFQSYDEEDLLVGKGTLVSHRARKSENVTIPHIVIEDWTYSSVDE